jgi:hypothetical protein
MPFEDQEERLGEIRTVHDDIVIAKLRPGQEIEARFVHISKIYFISLDAIVLKELDVIMPSFRRLLLLVIVFCPTSN